MDKGKLKIVSAFYNLGSGKVDFLYKKHNNNMKDHSERGGLF